MKENKNTLLRIQRTVRPRWVKKVERQVKKSGGRPFHIGSPQTQSLPPMWLNSTAVGIATAEALTSWGAVYIALFLPAVLMLGNFVFGNCFISDTIGKNQHTRGPLHSRYRVIGRGFVASVLALLAWEYHVYFFGSRMAIETSRPSVTEASCNPLYVLWDVVDALPGPFNAFQPSRYLFDCAWNDIVFLVLFVSFGFTYLMTVFSVPQVDLAKEPESRRIDISYCRKCAAYVYRPDHHCFPTSNCIGEANKNLFFVCLCCGFANLSFLLYWCGFWAFWQTSPVIHLGLLFVVVALAWMADVLAFHILLRLRGQTTLSVWKRARLTGDGLWWVLLTCPVENGILVPPAALQAKNGGR